MSYPLQKNLSHLGTIFFRLSLVSLVFIFGILVSQILILTFYVLLCLIGLLSLCTLFFVEEYRSLFDVTASFADFFNNATSYFPIFISISLILLLMSFACFIPNYKNSKKNIIFNIILLITLLVALIIYKQGGF